MSAIYGLYDPRVGTVRYVGKTTTPLPKRLGCHITEGVRLIEKRRHGTAVYQWIAKLLREGVNPGIRLLENCSEDIEDTLEREWIRSLQEAGIELLNGTEGGTGGRRTPATRAKMSQRQRQQWQDPEIRAKRIQGMSKPRNPFPDDFSAKRSEIQKQVWQDPDFRAHYHAVRSGVHHDQCVRGHPRTPENVWISPSTGVWYRRPCRNQRERDKRARLKAAC